MIDPRLFAKACAIAQRHPVQYKDGKPKDPNHPIMVAAVACNWDKGDEDAFIVGCLHDSLEDGYATFDELLDFPENIRRAVGILTKQDGEFYAEYINRVIRSDDPLALKVKKADATVNLARCEEDGDENRAEKYRRVLKLLSKEGS